MMPVAYLVKLESRRVLGLAVRVHSVPHPDRLSVISRGGAGQGQQQHVKGVNGLRPKPVCNSAVVMVTNLQNK